MDKPQRDLEVWAHNANALDDELLQQIWQELRNPMASSEGHKKTLRITRMLYDEVMRLRTSHVEAKYPVQYLPPGTLDEG